MFQSVSLDSTVGSGLCRLNYVIQLLLSDGQLGVIRATVVCCLMLHTYGLVFLLLSVATAVKNPSHRSSN